MRTASPIDGKHGLTVRVTSGGLLYQLWWMGLPLFPLSMKDAPHCQLIHLAIHAGADETDFAPRIGFIDQSFHLPDLYAMKIPADLVTLSTCETGLDRFEKELKP